MAASWRAAEPSSWQAASGWRKLRKRKQRTTHGKAKPTPRWPDGHPRLGVVPGEKGYWANPSAASLVETTAGNIRMDNNGLLANLDDASKVAPFQPWAKGLYEYRQRTLLKDDPMLSCLPPAGPRMFQVAHGVQFLEQPERRRVFVMSGGGNRNWRLIYLDGRALPQSEDVTPTYFGYSSGHWDGDTLVVESDAFIERFWFSNGGLPHTEGPAPYRKVFAPGFQHPAIRSAGERSGDLHAALVQRLDARLGGGPGAYRNISARTIPRTSLTWWGQGRSRQRDADIYMAVKGEFR